MKIAVFVGSIREGRTGITIGQWAIEQLEARNDGHEYLLIDILEQDLNPNTAVPPRMVANGEYADPKTLAWAELIGGVDAFIFVTPEYNASVPGPMKDAYDLLYAEWTGKPIGFIGYGSDAARTAVSHWNDIVGRVGMTIVPAQAEFTFEEHFPEYVFTPGEQGTTWINAIADELIDAAVTTQTPSLTS
ncbi:NADPH-dependent FMN reductase [Corynebacterium suedekumii]|uniref:NADPH-dependent FMN reductase n=1 Tax=Corynebacterium suedekumii TaxID=3049801 RepID=A0ABY8VM35_9CORY|nr:NADPH-dependent FMN reductase [Corynebacterium suedekumii]WIM70147.1 NADPH-dependent FMN reductase [Corynebacterium suedekumii]